MSTKIPMQEWSHPRKPKPQNAGNVEISVAASDQNLAWKIYNNPSWGGYESGVKQSLEDFFLNGPPEIYKEMPKEIVEEIRGYIKTHSKE